MRKNRNTLNSKCKSCYNKYFRNYYKNNREKCKAIRRNYESKWGAKISSELVRIKEHTPCADCYRFYPACAMDFDHIGQKNNQISNIKASSGDILLKEIRKCQLVCASCHRIRTNKRNYGDLIIKKQNLDLSKLELLVKNQLKQKLVEKTKKKDMEIGKQRPSSYDKCDCGSYKTVRAKTCRKCYLSK